MLSKNGKIRKSVGVVRVYDETHIKLLEYSKKTKIPMNKLVADAVELYFKNKKL